MQTTIILDPALKLTSGEFVTAWNREETNSLIGLMFEEPNQTQIYEPIATIILAATVGAAVTVAVERLVERLLAEKKTHSIEVPEHAYVRTERKPDGSGQIIITIPPK